VHHPDALPAAFLYELKDILALDSGDHVVDGTGYLADALIYLDTANIALTLSHRVQRILVPVLDQHPDELVAQLELFERIREGAHHRCGPGMKDIVKRRTIYILRQVVSPLKNAIF
jgi:hypothetical protein